MFEYTLEQEDQLPTLDAKNKKDIIKGATNENGDIDLESIGDFSVKYRDYLY